MFGTVFSVSRLTTFINGYNHAAFAIVTIRMNNNNLQVEVVLIHLSGDDSHNRDKCMAKIALYVQLLGASQHELKPRKMIVGLCGEFLQKCVDRLQHGILLVAPLGAGLATTIHSNWYKTVRDMLLDPVTASCNGMRTVVARHADWTAAVEFGSFLLDFRCTAPGADGQVLVDWSSHRGSCGGLVFWEGGASIGEAGMLPIPQPVIELPDKVLAVVMPGAGALVRHWNSRLPGILSPQKWKLFGNRERQQALQSVCSHNVQREEGTFRLRNGIRRASPWTGW
jgi:hypothetical protein